MGEGSSNFPNSLYRHSLNLSGSLCCVYGFCMMENTAIALPYAQTILFFCSFVLLVPSSNLIFQCIVYISFNYSFLSRKLILFSVSLSVLLFISLKNWGYHQTQYIVHILIKRSKTYQFIIVNSIENLILSNAYVSF